MISISFESKEDIGEAVYDNSRYDHATYGGTSNYQDILSIIFPETKGCSPTRQQIRDAMHVATHKKYGRDYFVTKDKAILRAKEKLEKIGIKVVHPHECVEELKKIIKNND